MFDYVLLFKRNIDNEETPSFSSKFPEVIDFPQEELQYVIPNSIPRKFDKSDVYMFNTPSFYCYDYSFKINSTEASVIIVSSHFHPSLYIDFLRAIDNSFNKTNNEAQNNSPSSILKKKNTIKNTEQVRSVDADTEIFCRFVYVHSLLTSWCSNDEGDLVINYPFDSFIVKLSPDLSIYSPRYKVNQCSQYSYIGADSKNFNPFHTRNDDIKAEDEAISALHSWTDVFDVAPLVPHVETLWAAAIQNKGVMIVAPSASIASYSAISIISMLEPMKYSEPCLLFTQIGDPRFTIEDLVPSALVKEFQTNDNFVNQENPESQLKSITENKFMRRVNSYDLFKHESMKSIDGYSVENNISLNDEYVCQTIENQIRFSTDDNFNNSLLRNNNQDIQDDGTFIPSQFKIVATTYESYAKLVRDISLKTSLSESQAISLLNINFSAIITIKATRFRPTQNLKKIYSKKTKQILKKFLSLMNLTLSIDPYFDLLSKEIDEKQFIRIWPNDTIISLATLSNISHNKRKHQNFNSSNSTSYSIENNNQSEINNNNNNTNDNNNNNNNSNNNSSNNSSNIKKINDDNSNNSDNEDNNTNKKNNGNSNISENITNDNNSSINKYPSPEELIEFYKNIQKTTTFKKWRHVREDRDNLRMGFLSISPKEAVKQIPDDKLQEAYDKVNLLLNIHQKDEHYRIILQKNLSLIKKRIRNIKH